MNDNLIFNLIFFYQGHNMTIYGNVSERNFKLHENGTFWPFPYQR